MCYLEPPDPVEVKCTECGEEENIKHDVGARWFCLACEDTFSDNSDYEDDYDGMTDKSM